MPAAHHDLHAGLRPLKLVISGAVGSGKTTLIQTLSETEIISTDVRASEDIGKEHTTVAFDFGTVHVGEDLLFLFGTPGQERFDFMWDVLCDGALGLLLLVSGVKPADFRHSKHILDFITTRFDLPYVVGVTHQDLPNAWTPEDVAEYFDVPSGRITGLTGTDPQSCKEALVALLTVIARAADERHGFDNGFETGVSHNTFPLSSEVL